jgi:hypothetical protein
MKLHGVVAISLLISTMVGCAFMMGSVRGQLGLSQRHDGKKTFTFLVATDAHKSSAPAAALEKARMDVLAGQLGKVRHCPKGYVVEKRIEIKEPLAMVSYRGYCT